MNDWPGLSRIRSTEIWRPMEMKMTIRIPMNQVRHRLEMYSITWSGICKINITLGLEVTMFDSLTIKSKLIACSTMIIQIKTCFLKVTRFLSSAPLPEDKPRKLLEDFSSRLQTRRCKKSGADKHYSVMDLA